MRFRIAVLALLLPVVASAQSDEWAEPSAADIGRMIAALNGPWESRNERGQFSLLAFAEGPLALRQGLLADVEMRRVRVRSDLDRVAADIEQVLAGRELSGVSDALSANTIERITEDLDVPDDALQQGVSEMSASLEQRVREDLETILEMVRDAQTAGDGTLTEIELVFLTPDYPMNFIEDDYATIAFSGDRLYRVERRELAVFDRVPDDHQAYRTAADNTYNRWFQQCVATERLDQPTDKCRGRRDLMARFGVELRPEFILERYRDFPKPTDAEMTFWREPVARGVPYIETPPVLDYCYSSADGHSFEAFMQDRAATGFSGTLWRLNIESDAPRETPRNWTDEEYRQWAPGMDVQISSVQAGALYLRADGVMGFSPQFQGLGFDPRNTWSYENGEIVLSWHDGVAVARVPVSDRQSATGSLNLALASEVYMSLATSNYDVLTKLVYAEMHPDREALLAAAADGSICSDVALTEIAIPEAEKPLIETVEWPVRVAGELPAHWYIRYEMTDGSVPADQEARKEMELGAFYHFDARGRVGFNREAPAEYLFSGMQTWERDGERLIWSIEGAYTLVFDLSDGIEAELVAVDPEFPEYRFLLTPTDMLVPGTREIAEGRVVESNVQPQSRAEANAVVAAVEVPEPVSAPAEAPAAQPAMAAQDITGCWRWSNGAMIDLQPGGTAINGAAQGGWQAGNSPNAFSIEWPPIVDLIQLSADGNSFSGRSVLGIQFSATRIGSGTGLAGQWRRQDGVTLEFAAGGAVTDGTLTGDWIANPDGSYVAGWHLVDRITMSADGDRLDVVNQFGNATAERSAGC